MSKKQGKKQSTLNNGETPVNYAMPDFVLAAAAEPVKSSADEASEGKNVSAETTEKGLKPNKKPKKQRAWELDALRGLAILLVIWDHFMFDLGYLFYPEWKYMGNATLIDMGLFARAYSDSMLRVFGWPVFVFIFFFVSGICTTFSRNNGWRGFKLLLVALGVSAVTYLIEVVAEFDGVFILFGVLHCLACCILIYSLFELILRFSASKHPKYRFIKAGVYLGLAVVLLVLNYTFNVTLYETNTTFATVDTQSKIAGMFVFTDNWWTADYFPLLPFFGFFMLGAGIAPLCYNEKKSLLPKLDGKWHYFLSYPGKYSLFIYLGLQVVAVAILYLLTLAVTGIDPFFG